MILIQDEARGFGPRHSQIMEKHGPPGGNDTRSTSSQPDLSMRYIEQCFNSILYFMAMHGFRHCYTLQCMS